MTAIAIQPGSAEDVISGARAVLQKGWTRHAGARNIGGEPVAMSSAMATCWCLGGALILSGYGLPTYSSALEIVAERIEALHPSMRDNISKLRSDSPSWMENHPGQTFDPDPLAIILAYNDSAYVGPVEVDDVLALLDGILE